jgi:Homeodomain-like domain
MDRAPVDADKILALHAEGLSQTEIARRLDIPPSTLRDRLKKLGLSGFPVTAPAAPPTTGIPQAIPQSDVRLISMISDLQELVAWWQERKTALEHASDGSRTTQRFTVHVEKRWIDAIRRKSDLDHLTYTQIVNDAFLYYFERK